MDTNKKGYSFDFVPKLGIHVPTFHLDWDEYSIKEQLDIIHQWEKERAKIPDRIKEIEVKIGELQDKMFEMEFDEYCVIHDDIINMASAINDLNIWFRIEGELSRK